MRRAQRRDSWSRLRRDSDGQDLMEYALLCALIVVAAVGVVTQVGTTVRDLFWDVIAATVGAI